jgi:hypothetical protein
LFVLWYRFRAGEFDRKELRRRLIAVQARRARLLRRRQENPDDRAAVLWRKGSFGSDSEAGSGSADRVLTAAATSRQQGRRRLVFLEAASEAALWGSPSPSLLITPEGG